MTAEKLFVDTLKLATQVTTYFGVQPQTEDDKPAPLPVVIVNRPGSAWPSGFCGTDAALAVTQLQADYYAETAEGARRLADFGRDALIALAGRPTLDTEFSLYDRESRAWRVIQRWTTADYAPALP